MSTTYDYPSRFESYQFWRKKYGSSSKLEKFTTGKGTLAEYNKLIQHGSCPICDDYKIPINPEDGKRYFCICSMIEWMHKQKARIEGLETFAKQEKLSELKPVGDDKSLITLKNSLVSFVKNETPQKPWFYIYGEKGSGKTHILMAMKNYFGPMAFYISSEEFQNHLHRCLSKKSSMDVQEFIEIVATAPILLFDDLGIEYKNSEYFIAQLAAVINMRYNRGQERFPLMLTSNIEVSDLILSPSSDIQRIGSRLADKEFVQIHKLSQADYRLMDRAK